MEFEAQEGAAYAWKATVSTLILVAAWIIIIPAVTIFVVKSKHHFALRVRSPWLLLMFGLLVLACATITVAHVLCVISGKHFPGTLILIATTLFFWLMYVDILRQLRVAVRFSPSLRKTKWVRVLSTRLFIQGSVVLLLLSVAVFLGSIFLIDDYLDPEADPRLFWLQREWFVVIPLELVAQGIMGRVKKYMDAVNDVYGVGKGLRSAGIVRFLFLAPYSAVNIAFYYRSGRVEAETLALPFHLWLVIALVAFVVTDVVLPLFSLKKLRYTSTDANKQARREESVVSQSGSFISLTSGATITGPVAEVQAMLSDAVLKPLFTAHTQRALCIEMILYWDDVQPLVNLNDKTGLPPSRAQSPSFDHPTSGDSHAVTVTDAPSFAEPHALLSSLVALHEKYIKENSPFQVNIAHATRTQFEKALKSAQQLGATATGTGTAAIVQSPTQPSISSTVAVAGTGETTDTASMRNTPVTAWVTARPGGVSLTGALTECVSQLRVITLEVERLLATNVYQSFVQSPGYKQYLETRRKEKESEAAGHLSLPLPLLPSEAVDQDLQAVDRLDEIITQAQQAEKAR